MTDFLTDLLGESSEVELAVVPLQRAAPTMFSPNPAATVARRIIGTPRKRKSNLHRLTQRHKIIIGMNLTGSKNAEIAEEVGCSVGTVCSILRDPLAQEVIMHYYEGVEDELKALFPKAVDAVRNALDDNAVGTKLKGVDRFMRLSGIGEGGPEGPNITVNVITDARTKFVQEIREAAAKRQPEVIDVTTVPVE